MDRRLKAILTGLGGCAEATGLAKAVWWSLESLPKQEHTWRFAREASRNFSEFAKNFPDEGRS
jgi:hypothetical protein